MPAQKSTDDETTPVTASGKTFKSSGNTLVRARKGYRFQPGDPNLPVVTSDGVRVTKTQAEALVAEAQPYGDLVYVVDESDTKEG